MQAESGKRTGSSGSQVAAEAMPYHTHRRTDCNIVAARPGMAAERESLAIPSGREHVRSPVGGRLHGFAALER